MKHTQDSLNLVDFAIEYPNKWHSYALDRKTLKAVKKACDLGIIEINEFNQFKLKEENNYSN